MILAFTGLPLLRQQRNCCFADPRPHKLHIPRPAASGRSRPFRCSSSPNCKRFAGLQFGSICLARKEWEEKRRLRRVILRADAREFLAAPRGLNALFGRKNVIFPIAYGSGQMYYTQLRAACDNFGSAHFRNTRPVTILHHRHIRRWPAISTAACFTIFPAWQRFSVGALSPRRRRCSVTL